MFSKILVASALVALPVLADSPSERLSEATTIINELSTTPEKGIPQDLLDRAHCVVVVPGLKKAAFIVGGQYGRGFAVCRATGGLGWGSPAAVRLEGGSFGFQIGAESTDLVMLIMNKKSMQSLMNDKFTLGGSASVAAGPVGRSVSANTNPFLSAGILAWSRSRGAFAGISLNGSTIRNDLDENQELYGRRLHNRDILMMKGVKRPAVAAPFIDALTKHSPREVQ